MLDQEDLQLIEEFKAENLQKKNKIVEEYRHYDIPNGYKMIVLRKRRPMSSTL